MFEISVLINNYNYGQFLPDAINSVLSQDLSDFELIIVDDGSTDNSQEVINSFNDPRIKVIFKENGGQLSAFNAGISAAQGNICCFLDADDIYSPGYLKAVAGFFRNTPECGCLFAPVEYIGARSGRADGYNTGRIGCNPFSASVRHLWTGTVTSACSIRRRELLKFMPYTENENCWVTRADDLLMWGADMVCAEKYALDAPAVQYRIHGNNLFFSKKNPSAEEIRKRREAVEAFCSGVMAKNRLRYSDMLRRENVLRSISLQKSFLSWLYAGKKRICSLPEWIKCGGILLFQLK